MAFDSKEKNFRRELYPEYKAKRLLPPEELIQQLPAIREYLAGRGIHSLEKPGLEGDDIIALLSRRYAAAGGEVLIFSADKDLFQLVGERVFIFHPKLKRKLGRADVKEFFGVFPEQIVDYLVLAGDASDNIPGIPGIGDKTATKLIEKFGSLEAMLEQPGPGRGQAPGKRSRPTWHLFEPWRRLLDFACIPSRGPRPGSAAFHAPQRRAPAGALPPPAVRQPAEKNGRDALRQRRPRPGPPVRLVEDPAQLKELAAKIRAAGSFAWDIETTALEFFKAEIVGAGDWPSPATAITFPSSSPPRRPAGFQLTFADFKPEMAGRLRRRHDQEDRAQPEIRHAAPAAPRHAGRRRRARHHDHVLPPLPQPPLPPAEGAERRIPGGAPDHL